MATTATRAPRYKRWIGTGAFLGLVLGLVVTALFKNDEAAFGTPAFYLGLTGAIVGAVIGGIVALAADRPANHRGR